MPEYKQAEEGDNRSAAKGKWDVVIHDCRVPSLAEITEVQATSGSTWACTCGCTWALNLAKNDKFLWMRLSAEDLEKRHQRQSKLS